jgi:hypothetical protein
LSSGPILRAGLSFKLKWWKGGGKTQANFLASRALNRTEQKKAPAITNKCFSVAPPLGLEPRTLWLTVVKQPLPLINVNSNKQLLSVDIQQFM